VAGGEEPATEGQFRASAGVAVAAAPAGAGHKGGPLADVLTDEQVVVHPLRNFTYEMCSGEECFRHGLAVRSYPVSDVVGTIRWDFRVPDVASAAGPG